MSRFSICIPDLDETEWHEVDYPNVYTVDGAAALYAERLCESDSESYGMFEDAGAIVLVKMEGQSAKVVRVTAERTWSFGGMCI